MPKPAGFIECVLLRGLFILSCGYAQTILTPQDSITWAGTYFADTIEVVEERHPQIPIRQAGILRLPVELHLAPVSAGIITQAVITAQNIQILSEALGNISGVTVQSALGTQDYFLIRGLESANAGLVLVDGTHQPHTSLFEIYGYGQYDLYNVERIEVIKGPAAFLYGGNTLSGTINLAPKNPAYRQVLVTKSDYWNNRSYRTTWDLEFPAADSSRSLRICALLKDLQSGLRPHSQHRLALNPILSWKPSKTTRISASLEYQSGTIRPDIGIPLYYPTGTWRRPEVPAGTDYQSPFDRLIFQKTGFRLGTGLTLSPAVTLHNLCTVSRVRGDTRLTLTKTPYYDRFEVWWVERNLYTFEEQLTHAGNRSEAVIRARTGPLHHTLLSGVELALAHSASRRALTPLSTLQLLDPVESDYDLEQLQTFPMIRTRLRQTLLAVYIIDQMTWGTRWQTYLGTRWDLVNVHSNRRFNPIEFIDMSFSSIPEVFNGRNSQFSPLLGVVVKESPHLWFQASYSKSFGRGVRIVDTPENSTQFEFGYRYHDRRKRLENSVTLYTLTKSNVDIPLEGIYQTGLRALEGRQRSNGLEFELSARPLDIWQVLISATLTEAVYIRFQSLGLTEHLQTTLGDFSGNTPPFIPAYQVNLWTTVQAGARGGIGGGWRYTGAQFVGVDNDYRLKGYATWILAAWLRGRRLSLAVTCRNPLGGYYYTRGTGPYLVTPTAAYSLAGSLALRL